MGSGVSGWGPSFGSALGPSFALAAQAASGPAWGPSFGGAFGPSFGDAPSMPSQEASGPGVVLFPHQKMKFRARGDFALFALASFVKQEALRVREKYVPLIEVRRVAIYV